MFYHIVTYGCQMNIHESEKLAGALDDLGYVSCENEQTADVIIFNTCAIREGAENRAIGNIGALKSLKKDKPELIIAVCGCMTQQQSAANYIYKTFPFVDIIFGTHDIEKFSSFLKNRLSTKQRIISHEKDNPKIWEDYHALRTSGENAWVNIMQGCNNFCSYCIVPFVRGREKSRTKEHIFAEIKKLIETKKYKTITLLGQNVNSYGHDLYEDYSFANLLKDICEIEGDFKLKFMTSHPKDISDDVINILASKDILAKELHLPVQSGSNAILKSMNRKYTVEYYKEIVDKIKSKIPNIKLSSDFIVGFPGETDFDFQQTLSLVKYVKYENLFAFIYSKRSGTVAEKMENQISDDVKTERVNTLLNLQKQMHKGN